MQPALNGAAVEPFEDLRTHVKSFQSYNGGVLSPLFPVVLNHLLCLDHVEGKVVVLAPHCQVSPSVISATTVVSLANVMMVLESCIAMQS